MSSILDGQGCVTHLHVPLAGPFFWSRSPIPSPQAGSQLTHGGDGLAVGYKTKAVLEDATAMKEREGDAHDLLQPVLDPAQPGAGRIRNLVK